jgi:hypothetical protein
MSRVGVIGTGRGAAEPPAPLQALARAVVALRDSTVPAGAVLNPAAELSDFADGRATRRSARERRQAAVAVSSSARLESADDLVNAGLTGRHPPRPDRTQPVTLKWTRSYPRQVEPSEPGGAGVRAGRRASTPVNHRPEAGAPREIPRRLTGQASRLKGIPLTRDYTSGRWRRSRSPQPPPDVTLASEALATGRRRLS